MQRVTLALELTALAGCMALALGAPAVHAADTPDPVPLAAPEVALKPAPGLPLERARALLQSRQWRAADDELRRVGRQSGAQANADWHNLMGYALRKQSPPDLAGAQRHYDAALRINPQHRGALEYAGELALMQNDLPAAQARLATLARLCTSPCEEHEDLKQAIARHQGISKR